MESKKAYKFRMVNSKCTSFAVERLNIGNMVKSHALAQSIYNASWNRFVQMLSYKAESAGMRVIKVDARDTTQECSNCHHIKTGNERLGLGDRIYHCNVCGMTMERDLNSAIVILYRAREGHSQSNAQGDECQYVPTGNANSVEELRTYPAIAGEAPTFR